MKSPRYYISRAIASCLDDKTYLSIKFRTRFGYWMDWKNPQTYSEKLQWLKIYDRHEEYTEMVDKAAVKPYVSRLIGEEYIIPTIGVYDSPWEIDFDSLPNQFVIKCTHDSGGLVICKDKSKLDRRAACKKLARALKSTYVVQNREYPYINVPRKLIVEPLISDGSSSGLNDYKIFCFDGEPKLLFVATDRNSKTEETKFDFFDLEWNHLPFTNGHPNSSETIPCPKNFDKMIEIARKLSQGIPQVRIDLYNCDGKIYFGEITFFHWSGMKPFKPREWDYKLGEMIKLPEA